ncbi:unnamed protein product [Linum tenue]|uniref:Uncharacterized protein n=1 Tax=Linum tenue TaxID=586396 RepID=A0AAV0P9N0_9ROSI|nr:unnamed protein product [Linum tenue]
MVTARRVRVIGWFPDRVRIVLRGFGRP